MCFARGGEGRYIAGKSSRNTLRLGASWHAPSIVSVIVLHVVLGLCSDSLLHSCSYFETNRLVLGNPVCHWYKANFIQTGKECLFFQTNTKHIRLIITASVNNNS